MFQKLISRIFIRLMKSWSWVLLIVLAIFTKWISWYPEWVENNYTYGAYLLISKVQRFLLGWIPFSIGDLFYGFIIVLILVKIVRFFKIIIRRNFSRSYFITSLQQFIFLFLFIYVSFNLLWGLNYNRLGISSQLDVRVKAYSLADLDTLVGRLQQHLNLYADSMNALSANPLHKKKALFSEAAKAFHHAEKEYPFLKYSPSSVKPSIFSYLGNYLGFQGYYNPFTGEAQVNTTIPHFLEPFVTTHEIAHQLGYGKENEANFVGFLACKAYPSVPFRYSMYFDMYNYAINELFRRDTTLAYSYRNQLHPQVRADIEIYRRFLKAHKNPVENMVMWGYSHYLKVNNQPAGKETYNEVVAWLVAYYKKFGVEAL